MPTTSPASPADASTASVATSASATALATAPPGLAAQPAAGSSTQTSASSWRRLSAGGSSMSLQPVLDEMKASLGQETHKAARLSAELAAMHQSCHRLLCAYEEQYVLRASLLTRRLSLLQEVEILRRLKAEAGREGLSEGASLSDLQRKILNEEHEKNVQLSVAMAKTSARIQQLHVEREILEQQKKQLYTLVGQFLQQRATGTLEAAAQTKQELKQLYIYCMITEECRSIFSNSLAEQPIHKDLPRLARSFTLVNAQGKVLLEPAKDATLLDCIRWVLTSLATLFDTPQLSERIAQEIDTAVVLEKEESLLRFLSDRVGEETATVNVLKACNQATIAPFISRFKHVMDAVIPFNSMRNGWTITVRQRDLQPPLIVHRKRERAAPTAEDIFTAFQFEWRMEFALDPSLTTVREARATIGEFLNVEGAPKEVEVEFREVLRQLLAAALTQDITEPPNVDVLAVQKRLRKLKEKITRKRAPTTRNKKELERGKQRAIKDAMKRQKKELRALRKQIEAGHAIDPSQLRMLRALEEIGVDIVKQVGITLPPASPHEVLDSQGGEGASLADPTLLTHEWSFDSGPHDSDPLSPRDEALTPRVDGN